MKLAIILSISFGLNLYFIISGCVRYIRRKFEEAVLSEVNRRNDIKFAKKAKKAVSRIEPKPDSEVSQPYRIPRGG